MCKAIISALLTIYLSTSEAATNVPMNQCQLDNKACLDNIVNTIKPIIFGQIPEIGVESSDPMFIPNIFGDISGLRYNLHNSTWIGYSKCVFSNMTINEDITKIEFDMDCPSLDLSGMYELDGEMLSLPVKGNGEYLINAGYHIHFVSKLLKANSASGKTYISLENFKLNCVPLFPVHFEFKNMYNGERKLSDKFYKVLRDNWRLIAELFDGPIWYTCIGKVVNNLNNFFRNVPLDDFIDL